MATLAHTLNDIQILTARYQPIALDRLEQAALPRRVDTKFILPISKLGTILQESIDDYYILLVKEIRVQKYQTLYFDTSDFQFYLAHHNGKLNRYKIRIRKYVNSDFCCLEVKFKNNLGQTLKKRRPILRLAYDLTSLDDSEEVQNFIQQTFPCNYRDLRPKLFNDFQRITLVHKHDVERVTVDLTLHFDRPVLDNLAISDSATSEDAISNFQTLFSALALVEIKQEKFSMHSPFLQQMRKSHINTNPTSFSKYCIGMALLNPHLKANNFKPIFLHAQKVARQSRLHWNSNT